jgi:hypothetical protein
VEARRLRHLHSAARVVDQPLRLTPAKYGTEPMVDPELPAEPKPTRTRRWPRRTAIAIAVVAILGLLVLRFGFLTVRVHNGGNTVLRGAILEISERQYPLGDIHPGSTSSRVLRVHQETGIRIRHGDRFVNAKSYLSAGTVGVVEVVIHADGSVVVDTSRVSLAPW